jgi:hypothetical protein
MQSSAKTVAAYLEELEPARRKDIAALRKHIKKHLPAGYKEVMNWGMICYEVPLSVSGPTYNKQPLPYVALASQKNYISLYLSGVYASSPLEQKFKKAWAASGKKLDMGKSCIRLKSADSADLEAVALAVAACTPQEFVEVYLTSTNRGK